MTQSIIHKTPQKAKIKSLWMSEKLHDSFRVSLRVEAVLMEERTEHHHLVIFENSHFGRVMMLDDVIQLTQADEFIYHEMMAHIPLFAHGAAQNVLIIGGGDGGVAREVLRHKQIENLILCEIDKSVIETGQRYFPSVCANAFQDPRLTVTIMDGTKFVAETKQKFDVILVDSTDPIGPGVALFTAEFYQNCANCLTPDGILVTQNGVPFLQTEELSNTMHHFRALFADYSAFTAATPTYVGGLMSYGWGSHNVNFRNQPTALIQERFDRAGLDMKYYNPEIHKAAFALPEYIKNLTEISDRP